MESFRIRIMEFNESYWQTVEGIKIKIVGFEFFPLFIYQADGSYGLGGKNHTRVFSAKEIKGKYIVTEEKSGYWCGILADDPEEAYSQIKHKLEEIAYTQERYQAALGKVI